MKRKLFKYFLAIVILIIVPYWQLTTYYNYMKFIEQKAFVYTDHIHTITYYGIPMLAHLLMIVCAYFSIKLINIESKIEEALKTINNAKQKE